MAKKRRPEGRRLFTQQRKLKRNAQAKLGLTRRALGERSRAIAHAERISVYSRRCLLHSSGGRADIRLQCQQCRRSRGDDVAEVCEIEQIEEGDARLNAETLADLEWIAQFEVKRTQHSVPKWIRRSGEQWLGRRAKLH